LSQGGQLDYLFFQTGSEFKQFEGFSDIATFLADLVLSLVQHLINGSDKLDSLLELRFVLRLQSCLLSCCFMDDEEGDSCVGEEGIYFVLGDFEGVKV
jgi:hypothetical protein